MKKVAIIGLGTMGSLIETAIAADYQTLGFDKGDDLESVRTADIIIIAVKPQSFSDLSQELRRYTDGQTIISIMAGVSCKQISALLNTTRIVRTMPNVGLVKAKSLTGAYAFDAPTKQPLDELLKLWGPVIWLPQEADFDGFTALAGSGPAYFFEMVNQLQKTAEQLGFQPELSKKIANNTLMSAAAALDYQSAAGMVDKVASKGGTTEAAMAELAKHNFSLAIKSAVTAAATRSKELSG